MLYNSDINNSSLIIIYGAFVGRSRGGREGTCGLSGTTNEGPRGI